MDWDERKENALGLIRRCRWFLVVLAFGIGLMLLPSKKETGTAVQTVSETTQQTQSLEESLAEILSGLSGAGKVKVLLSQSQGEEVLYQCNETYSQSDASSNDNTQTVLVTDASRNQLGLIRQVNPPRYFGAVVLCQGAENASIRLAIVEAVSNATGLPTHKISVLKMK